VEEAQTFRRASRAIEFEWIEDMNKRGLPGKKLLDGARSLIDKHTSALAKPAAAGPKKKV
jgi:hypothetical protein